MNRIVMHLGLTVIRWLCLGLLLLPLTSQAQSGSLVISQLYTVGGNSGAKYQNDYIELFNRSTGAVALNGYSLALFTAAGSSAASTLPLKTDATIPAGGYYLVQLGGGANGVALPTPDQTGTYNLSSTAGRVDLLLSGNLIDRVGYGASATTYEGSGPAAAPTVAQALFRALGGCTDANSNDKDLTTNAPAPRNKDAVGNNCNGPAPTISSFAPAAGPVGSTITLGGSGFTSSATVTVGGVAATAVSCSSPTALTATVPSGATSGPITVMTATGTATSADSYTVLVPVITVAPASLSGLVATQGSSSPVQTYQVSGSSLDGTNLTIKASTTNLEVSLDGSTYAQTASLALGGNAALAATPVYVRVASGVGLGSVSGNVANTNGATTSTVAVSGAVVAPINAKRWLGKAGTTSWFDADNWEGGTLPGASDDVVLDHRYVAGKYTVVLGSSASTTPAAVQLASLRLRPLKGDSILFLIPSSNTVSTSNTGLALSLTRNTAGDTALYVGSRAFFTNASGATSGNVLDVAGANPTVFLLNGGSYRHQTARGVTALVENLSGATGTEVGNFYYRPASTGSFSVPIAGRTYGNLIFQRSSVSSYTNSGNTPLTVNGTLTVENGVTFVSAILGNIILRGNLVNAGTFRMAPNSTGTTVRLVLQGTAPQSISGNALGDPSAGGSYLNADAQLEISNPAGATLQAPVTVSNALALSSGLLTTSATNVLTLGAAATVQGGSDASFVNGPVRRPIGPISSPTSFVFPVGKGVAYRPLTLTVNSQTSTTVYRAEQFEGNTLRTLATADPSGSPLTRVSRVRYFTLTPFNTDAVPVVAQPAGFSGGVTLTLGPGDGVTDLSLATLVVAKRSDATQPWYNFGHRSSTGTTGAGSLTSGDITSFSDFALGSTDAATAANPLPVQLARLVATRTAGGPVALGWATASELHSARFEVERSADGFRFEQVAVVAAAGSSSQPQHYAARDVAAPATRLYYRLRQVDQDGTAAYSPTVAVAAGAAGELTLLPNPAHDQLSLLTEQPLPYLVRSALGQPLLTGTTAAGLTTLSVSSLAPGVYFFELYTGAGRVVRRFSKE